MSPKLPEGRQALDSSLWNKGSLVWHSRQLEALKDAALFFPHIKSAQLFPSRCRRIFGDAAKDL